MPEVSYEDIINHINQLKEMLDSYSIDNAATRSSLYELGRELEELSLRYRNLVDFQVKNNQ